MESVANLLKVVASENSREHRSVKCTVWRYALLRRSVDASSASQLRPVVCHNPLAELVRMHHEFGSIIQHINARRD